MGTLITSADIQSRVPPDDYLKMFDRDRDGTPDAPVLATCINTGDSKVRMRTQAYFGGVALDDPHGAVDEAIKDCVVAYACECAVIYNPLYSDRDAAPFRAAAKRADEFLDRLARDDRNRVVTAAGGRARPRAVLDNAVGSDGVTPTNPFNRAADGSDRTGF